MVLRSGLSLAKDCGAIFCMAVMLISATVQANVTVSQSGPRVVLENAAVRFVYDLSRG
ncbi:MAG: hypothetical protein HQ515_01215, partial [Phycisphaeraceae bacterium]|nr:hypothetical protein [Phycisphaeraceae bacterium]